MDEIHRPADAQMISACTAACPLQCANYTSLQGTVASNECTLWTTLCAEMRHCYQTYCFCSLKISRRTPAADEISGGVYKVLRFQCEAVSILPITPKEHPAIRFGEKLYP